MDRLEVTIDGQTYLIELDCPPKGQGVLSVRVNGEPAQVVLPDQEAELEKLEWIVINDRPYEISFDQHLNWIKDQSGKHQVELHHLADQKQKFQRRSRTIDSPIPGQISQVLVVEGQAVETGDPVVILEAMKMFNEIRAPCSGRVKSVCISPGENVGAGQTLINIDF